MEICAEYVVIHCAEELEHIVRLFKFSVPNAAGKRLGDRTLRIDLKIIGPYDPKLVIELLRLTPNLLVLLNNNNHGWSDLSQVPDEVMLAICTYGSNLRRLEFNSLGEAPSLLDLIDVSGCLEHLETLRVLCIHSYPTDPETFPQIPISYFKTLKTLSLGVIPKPSRDSENTDLPPGYFMYWDPFLTYLGMDPDQLPCLTRLECPYLPPSGMSFFQQQGHKLLQLRTHTAAQDDNVLSEVLSHCINLESLVLAHGTRVPRIPPLSLSVKRLCIVPYIEGVVEVPPHVFRYAVLQPLEDLFNEVEKIAIYPIREIRLRDLGAFAGLVDHTDWLQTWWRRFNIRGIAFVDKDGKEFDDPIHPLEILLNELRS